MAKQKKKKQLLPPRYPRGDPRNMERQSAGAVRGRKMQGYDHPVRKLRKRNGSYMVSIPKWLVEEFGWKVGDNITFTKIEVPGIMVICAIKRPEVPAGTPAAG
ncbi:hypothetical protein ES703_106855 [subsurface metagenome]